MSFAPSGYMAGAFAPAKLRKDGLRLGLVAALSIAYALLFEQAVIDVLLIGLNGVGCFIAAIALVVAAFAVRRHGQQALTAAAVYGLCVAAHVAAIMLLLRH